MTWSDQLTDEELSQVISAVMEMKAAGVIKNFSCKAMTEEKERLAEKLVRKRQQQAVYNIGSGALFVGGSVGGSLQGNGATIGTITPVVVYTAQKDDTTPVSLLPARNPPVKEAFKGAAAVDTPQEDGTAHVSPVRIGSHANATKRRLALGDATETVCNHPTKRVKVSVAGHTLEERLKKALEARDVKALVRIVREAVDDNKRIKNDWMRKVKDLVSANSVSYKGQASRYRKERNAARAESHRLRGERNVAREGLADALALQTPGGEHKLLKQLAFYRGRDATHQQEVAALRKNLILAVRQRDEARASETASQTQLVAVQHERDAALEQLDDNHHHHQQQRDQTVDAGTWNWD